ncbi:hypothetical protein E1171_02945 [Cytophagales bacterium RKSG123]|nr:hypothetical protein [Xanthovirga aplysinae]
MNWMISSTQTRDGQIIFDKESGSITFKKAYCIRYKEVFKANNNSPLILELEIVAKAIERKSITHQRNWGSE